MLVTGITDPYWVPIMKKASASVTDHGGRTSHAALVARQFGKPAVVGVSALQIDMRKRQMLVKDQILREGEWISIDGTEGHVYAGKLETTIPDIKDPWLMKLLGWADGFRSLGVWTNADYPSDARRARDYGAEGIGLCRTEHMFFETERLPLVQKMIMNDLSWFVRKVKRTTKFTPDDLRDVEISLRDIFANDFDDLDLPWQYTDDADSDDD